MLAVTPPLDPLAHRTAIDAMEAQRAAYRRLAREADAQHASLGGGDIDQTAAFTDGAVRDVAELHDGAHAVQALAKEASRGASPDQMRDIDRRMEELTREARTAETAIRNLTTQLEAWRDAFGRQLAEVGITPGAPADGASPSGTADAPETVRRTYGPLGRDASMPPRIFDRRG